MMISADNITYSYPGLGRNVVTGMSFAIDKGEFVALIGPNGAGKTTVFRILGGYVRPSSGNVRIKDRSILEMSRGQRAGILAVVPQNVFTPLPYSVRQIVEMGRVSRLSRFIAPSKRDIKVISDAMALMDVENYSGTPFSNLSGGEKQRVMLAMALAQEPEILLLDEPTAHLDIGHSFRLMKILGELNRKGNLTIILISHDINIAARYSSRMILMKEGRILKDGDVDSVLDPGLIGVAYGCKVSTIGNEGKVRFVVPS
ncbi:MAG TPA: ABC transporter [Lentisphaeria bacterium]|nr:MAG: hypothetical protein A2X45_23010 [Lentisphaerae bacterium GWF2_50_93]HCE46717.1 ABC transporter [Lentisphaeria bacterium]